MVCPKFPVWSKDMVVHVSAGIVTVNNEINKNLKLELMNTATFI